MRKRKRQRSRLEMVTDILLLLVAGIHKPTRLMSRANLSWYLLMKHLEPLERAELIVVEERGSDLRGTRRYDITPKGRDFLKEAKITLVTLEEMFKEVEK